MIRDKYELINMIQYIWGGIGHIQILIFIILISFPGTTILILKVNNFIFSILSIKIRITNQVIPLLESWKKRLIKLKCMFETFYFMIFGFRNWGYFFCQKCISKNLMTSKIVRTTADLKLSTGYLLDWLNYTFRTNLWKKKV